MSWNEPGGSKKDPWSGRDQQDTPPDLDEVLRKLRDGIGGLFGGNFGHGGSPGKTLALLAGIPLAIWGLTGIYIVDEGNRGVVTRFGKYTETTLPGPHWHLPAPIESKAIVNVEQQRFIEVGYRSGGGRQQNLGSVPKEALMLTQDENIVDIRLAVQYQIKDARAYLFNVYEPEKTLKEITESAERGIIGKSTMNYVLTEGRSGIADEIKQEIQEVLDKYEAGIRVITVNFVDAQVPEEVQSAFEDAIKAREDEQRLKNEAEAYANEVVPKARGAAARLLEESEAYKQRTIAKAQGEAGRFKQLLTEYEKAPEITRQRLYLDTIESVLQKSNTLMLDVKGGNNMIYLPIDKLQRQSTALDIPRESEGVSASVADSIDNSAKNANRAATLRGRESRGQ
ncbi:FtsH protease activity modulator HflK [Methylococcus sp. EFPC2]|uniref:FtsH protease activity modulator HflK n=1 Tax=Methylococcus sp. EFPC2 TaxID=2812648 RepID=UPI001966D47E|nr:FtsH protease activity modulator HflK [Methylococcus sp. EFPC2]QSA98310.1 FtsH protease activity modulator HflK [Methylococcus sp. EFPC2]